MAVIDWARAHTPTRLRPAFAAAHRAVDNHLTSDKAFIQREYARVFGAPPDLERPRTFNEKMQWRKLYDRRRLHQVMCDKVAVRDYVAARVGAQHLVPLLGVFDAPDSIPWAGLPTPYVVKAAHGCGLNYFAFDSADVAPAELIPKLREWIKANHFYVAREWGYKDVPKRLLVERFIGSEKAPPEDYKFFCFNGVPRLVYVVQDRLARPTITWYDSDWTPLPFSWCYPQGPTRPAPTLFAEMLAIAGRLSQELDFLRVDLYCVDGHVYCGELTVYPGGGFERFIPHERDEWLGRFWSLPGVEENP